MTKLIEVNNLHHTYTIKRSKWQSRSKVSEEKEALRAINLNIYEGETLGIIGHNGAGKSTLIKCLTRLIEPTSGQTLYHLRGGSKHIYQHIGVQLQESHFEYEAQVGALVGLYVKLSPLTTGSKGNLRADANLRAQALVESFGLSQEMGTLVRNLSGGMKQKLAILLSLIHNPQILFLDELTTGLDPVARHEVWKVIKGLQNEGLTVVLTSHYMDEVFHLCDRVMAIKEGCSVYQGSVNGLIDAYHPNNTEGRYDGTTLEGAVLNM